MYYDLRSLDNPTILEGKQLASVKVFFLDYETDDVINTLLSNESGDIIFYPENTRKFYCVVITSEYELYISKPIQALGGEKPQGTHIILDKADSKYSPPFRVRIQACDSSQTTQNFSILSNTTFTFRGVDNTYSDHSSFHSIRFEGQTNDSGIIRFGSKCYFSLNSRYVLDVSLKAFDISSGKEMYLPYKTIDGSIKNTNLIDVFFEYDGSNISLQ